MPGGSTIDTFFDFLEATTRAKVSSTQEFVNEATAQSYLLEFFLSGPMEDMLRGGTEITETIMFDEKGQYGTYSPGDTEDWKIRDVLERTTVPWTFSDTAMVWYEQELALNTPSGATAQQLHHIFVDMQTKKERQTQTDVINGMEDQLLAVPDNSLMEAKGATTPMSIFALINEEPLGLYPGFTTVQQVDPSLEAGWIPVQQDYTVADPAAEANGLLNALDDATMLVRYRPTPVDPTISRESTHSDMMIITQSEGMNQYRRVQREANNSIWVHGHADPGHPNPIFIDIPIIWIPAMDTAPVYDDGSSGRVVYNSGSAAVAGARYIGINKKELKMYFHTENMMKKLEPERIQGQKDIVRQRIRNWNNLLMSSRQRQFHIKPV